MVTNRRYVLAFQEWERVLRCQFRKQCKEGHEHLLDSDKRDFERIRQFCDAVSEVFCQDEA